MTPLNKNDKETSDYIQAEKMINQTIANMDETAHVEYGSIIERSDKPSHSKWLDKITLFFKKLCTRF